MINMFLSNNPSSGDINSSNLSCYISVKLLIELNLVFLSLTGGCTGSSESTLVKMAHCWKSHVTVQIFLNTGPRR